MARTGFEVTFEGVRAGGAGESGVGDDVPRGVRCGVWEFAGVVFGEATPQVSGDADVMVGGADGFQEVDVVH